MMTKGLKWIDRLAARFPSPVVDSSGKLFDAERRIILRMTLGQELVCGRLYHEESENYAVEWYWSVEPKTRPNGKQRKWYPRQWDGPVMRLIGREMIRPISCAGGYTRMIFTEKARKVILKMTGLVMSTALREWKNPLGTGVDGAD